MTKEQPDNEVDGTVDASNLIVVMCSRLGQELAMDDKVNGDPSTLIVVGAQ